jgi:Cof subfamily protein (haloacid dehalogenase superfamily)
MNKKTIFFDIDGTLLGTKDGRRFCIPPSALQALRTLKQGGHRVVICSGRQEAFIHKFFPNIFTSYVAMNGTHVVYDGKTILDCPFSRQQVAKLMSHFDSYRCSYTFVGKTNGWARNLPEQYLEKLNVLYGFSDFLKVQWQPEEVDANMMDFIFQSEEEFERCRSAFSGSMVLNRHPGQLAADLSFKEQDKSKGIQAFLEYAGIDKGDTIAFGDGYNDVTMMGAVGCGIAMGNAVEDVKKAADYVTDAVFDDGIYKALEHFGLI